MTSPTNRREVLRALFATSVGGVLSTSRLYGSRTELTAGGGEQHDFAPVRQRILEEVASGKATGVAVAVVHKGHLVWEEGFGFSDREKSIRATARTPFCLASITKPFTTTMLMTLVAEGKVALDAPANQYLSGAGIRGPNGNPHIATVRLLGAHVSGLPGMFSGYFQGGPTPAPDAKAVLQEYGRLAYSPGSVYEYSNIGFSALGAIASNVTGTDFGTLMKQRVLQPLGLNDSFFSTDIARLSTRAIGYDDAGKPIPYYTTSTPPSGELYVSAHDLAFFAMWNMKNHVPGQKRILEERWIDELHKPVYVGPSGVATTFGWFTGTLKSGLPYVLKSGGQPGVATKLYMVPSEDLACLVLTNRTDGTELANGICNQILKSYLSEWTPPEENAGPRSKPFVATSEFIGRWKGTLWNGGAEEPLRLQVDSSTSATLALGTAPATEILQMQSQGPGVEGVSTGLIESDGAGAFGVRKLVVKLIPQDGKLVGRVMARGEKTGLVFANLPYVLTLDRVLD
ncbi:serine hydrolase domain-containing protein [Tunturiibacter empetritectus]|uniref:CubicO group peptidase (Beta-lactamase class C family) n=1 Tax=Tunturiibacter lichenicola TaxID=2051959 RepID=A0A852VH09_9BACT|nr:serine hydrolase domain-containing protein [Edaphobacter lichenicola]NYF90920.1 CubicO group peptidase (beta-lactamase class C family) [Edaphobacter lichenicola]